MDFKVKQLEVDGRKYKLSIWVSACACVRAFVFGFDRVSLLGYSGTGEVPDTDVELLPRSTRCNPRSVPLLLFPTVEI